MAAITNYSTLVQNIQDATETDGAEFIAYIPTAIALAEEKLFRELDLPELETVATGSLSSGTNTVSRL